jgi:hypothetical protein
MMPDPFTYVGRVKRDSNGIVRSMEIFHPDDMISLEQGDEFVTFVTSIDLGAPDET